MFGDFHRPLCHGTHMGGSLPVFGERRWLSTPTGRTRRRRRRLDCAGSEYCSDVVRFQIENHLLLRGYPRRQPQPLFLDHEQRPELLRGDERNQNVMEPLTDLDFLVQTPGAIRGYHVTHRQRKSNTLYALYSTPFVHRVRRVNSPASDNVPFTPRSNRSLGSRGL